MLLRKAFGNKQIDSLLEQAKTAQQTKQRDKRFRNNNFERLGADYEQALYR